MRITQEQLNQEIENGNWIAVADILKEAMRDTTPGTHIVIDDKNLDKLLSNFEADIESLLQEGNEYWKPISRRRAIAIVGGAIGGAIIGGVSSDATNEPTRRLEAMRFVFQALKGMALGIGGGGVIAFSMDSMNEQDIKKEMEFEARMEQMTSKFAIIKQWAKRSEQLTGKSDSPSSRKL